MTPTPDTGRGKPLLLVVDDEPSNILTLYEILKPFYEVCMATSGRDALQFCESNQPDLVLLDVMMPDLSGYEVCRQLKANEATREVPVLFVTAQSDPDDEAHALDEGAVDFISKPVHDKVVLARVRTQLTIKMQAERLRSLAMIDGLTGVANRRQIDATLVREWRHCMRSRSPLAVLLIDVDYFKRYNDHYGHLAGDACLQAISGALEANVRRPHDLVGRFGGEEFVCVLPETPVEGAEQRANVLVEAVRALCIPHERSDASKVVTVSVGAAVTVPVRTDDPDSLIAAADTQLYAAKQAGRAQAQCALVPSKPGPG
jgi:diguanylate cyclase (GGDEF)-like protein